MPAETADGKGFREGTHRVCAPADTLARIGELAVACGVTRLADLTGLDRLRIPVYQAVRPSSWSLSVSQGKGLTSDAAKVSALMESIETWHAERLPAPELNAAVGEIGPFLGYDVYHLRRPALNLLSDHTRLSWLPAQHLVSGAATYVPFAYVSLDLRAHERWEPPLLAASSKGLASGNTLTEAILHGLCEVVERDGVARMDARPPDARTGIRLASIGGHAGDLVDRLRRGGADVRVHDARGPSGVPCFEAQIALSDHRIPGVGMGCHPDPDVALCRALTEAAQSRLTLISGVRDDIPPHAPAVIGSFSRPAIDPAGEMIDLDEIEGCATDDLERDLREVTRRVVSAHGEGPVVVEIAAPPHPIAVVKVIVPALGQRLV